MASIILKAKVKLMSEEMIELRDKDLGDVDWKDGNKWVWRRMGIDANDIKKVLSHSPAKSLIIEYDDTTTMIAEPFAEVYKKWSENITLETDFIMDGSEESEEEETKDEDENE